MHMNAPLPWIMRVTALQSTFGATREGPLAGIVVWNRGALNASIAVDAIMVVLFAVCLLRLRHGQIGA